MLCLRRGHGQAVLSQVYGCLHPQVLKVEPIKSFPVKNSQLCLDTIIRMEHTLAPASPTCCSWFTQSTDLRDQQTR